MLRWVSLVLALVAPLAAFGQDCPEGASTEVGYDEGERLRLLAFHPDDVAHAEDVGVEGVVDDGLQNVGECWFQGHFTTTDGRRLELSKVAVASAKRARAPACPEGSMRGPIADGSAVRVLGIHPADAYYPDRPDLVGRVGFFADGLDGGCWRGGRIRFDDGSSAYFYKVALAPVPEAPGRMWLGGVVPKDRPVDILAIHAADRHYAERDALIGKHCVATSVMYSIQQGWLTGPVRCDDGQDLQFYKVAVSLPNALGVGDEYTHRVGGRREPEPPGGCPDGSEPGGVPAGTRVRVVGIGPDDPRSADAASLVGMVGVIATNETSGACWVRGELTPDEGPSIYFRQAAVAPIDPPCPAGGSRLPIDEGTWLELVGLHPDDAHADDAARWVGTRFVAGSEEMWPRGCWYTGRVAGADGAESYFLGASFRTLSDPCPPGALTDPPQTNDPVRILAVGPGDAYYGMRGELNNMPGFFAGSASIYGSCWLSGQFKGSDFFPYFLRVALAPADVDLPPAPAPFTSSTIFARTSVVVLDVDLFDPAFPARDALRGTTCKAEGTLVQVERGWYSGKVSCAGTAYTFAKVRLGKP